MRAATQLLKSGQIQTGGSTITMQVAKNYFLTSERSFSRKINEILLALQIERAEQKRDPRAVRQQDLPRQSRLWNRGRRSGLLRQAYLRAERCSAGDDRRPAEGPIRIQPIGQSGAQQERRIGSSVACIALAPDESSYRQALAEPETARYHGATPGSTPPISPRWHAQKWSAASAAPPYGWLQGLRRFPASVRSRPIMR